MGEIRAATCGQGAWEEAQLGRSRRRQIIEKDVPHHTALPIARALGFIYRRREHLCSLVLTERSEAKIQFTDLLCHSFNL
jgi:hypothetical protein